VKTYAVRGPLFFASSNDLVYQFDYVGDPARVIIDLSDSQIFDSSTVAALDAIELKYAQHGKQVEIVGLNQPSLDWHGRLSGRLGAGH
jgi:SulP family sulfate permease